MSAPISLSRRRRSPTTVVTGEGTRTSGIAVGATTGASVDDGATTGESVIAAVGTSVWETSGPAVVVLVSFGSGATTDSRFLNALLLAFLVKFVRRDTKSSAPLFNMVRKSSSTKASCVESPSAMTDVIWVTASIGLGRIWLPNDWLTTVQAIPANAMGRLSR